MANCESGGHLIGHGDSKAGGDTGEGYGLGGTHPRSHVEGERAPRRCRMGFTQVMVVAEMVGVVPREATK